MDKFVFVGIQINHHSPHFTYIALNEENVPLAIDHGDLENLLSYVAGQEKAILSINASLHLNTGLLKTSPKIKHHSGKRPNIRLVEYELESFGVEVYRTSSKFERCDIENQLGIQLNDYLTKLGYLKFPQEDSNRVFFETPANAAFWSLITGEIVPQSNFIGLMQRQQILYDLELPIINPMDFLEELTRYKLKIGKIPFEMILPIQEQNAWICAYTAKKAWEKSDEMKSMGNEEEGFIYLPSFPPEVLEPESDFQTTLF